MIATAILIALASFGVVQYKSYSQRAMVKRSVNYVAAIKERVMLTYIDRERFPKGAELQEINTTFANLPEKLGKNVESVILYSKGDGELPALPAGIQKKVGGMFNVEGYIKTAYKATAFSMVAPEDEVASYDIAAGTQDRQNLMWMSFSVNVPEYTLIGCQGNQIEKRDANNKIICVCGDNQYRTGSMCYKIPANAVMNEDGTGFDCLAGYYKTIWEDMETCLACQSGTFTPKKGFSKCDACKAGTYANKKTAATDCIDCPAGTASPEPKQFEITACVDCVAGTYATGGNAKCSDCKAGSWSDTLRAENEKTCIPCNKGTASNKVGKEANNQEVCEACKPGSYAAELGQSSCTLCIAGTFATETGATSNICQNCSPGQSTENNIGQSSCTKCKPGSYATGSGNEFCPLCPKGFEAPNEETTVCDPCQIGKYAINEGTISCSNCPKGRYTDTIKTIECKQCPAGTFVDAEGSDSISDCNECPDKHYSGAGASSCLLCEAGHYLPDKTQCPLCPASTYSDEAGMPKCPNCESGWRSTLKRTSCYQCPAGTKLVNATDLSCTNCEAKHYSFAGWTSCKPCYQSCSACTDEKLCTSCDPGYELEYDSGVQAAQNICTACKAGYFSAKGGTVKCAACPAGEYANNIAATSCKKCKDDGKGNTYSTGGANVCLAVTEVDNCATYLTTKDLCDTCKAGYGYRQHFSHNMFIRCHDCKEKEQYSPGGKEDCKDPSEVLNCVLHSHIKDACIACDAGYYVNGDKSCPECPFQTYSTKAQAKKKEDCKKIATVLNCSNYSKVKPACTGCEAKYKLVSDTKCEECSAGYYSKGGVGVTTCTKSSDVLNCIEYSKSEDKCVTCESKGYYLDKTNNVCKSCPVGCLTCTSETVCGDCDKENGYTKEGTLCKQLEPCKAGTKSVNKESPGYETCELCTGKSYSSEDKAINCSIHTVGNCSKFSNVADECISCNTGFYKVKDCEPCQAGCSACTDGTSCTGDCSINDGYKKINGACVKVTECQPGTYSSDGYESCTACSAGYYSGAKAIKCEKVTIDDGINGCSKYSNIANACTECKPGFGFNGTNCEACDSSYNYSPGGSNPCIHRMTIITGCQQYSNITGLCDNCYPNFEEDNGNCIAKTLCQPGFASNDGYEPCNNCADINQYSDSTGAKSCKTHSATGCATFDFTKDACATCLPNYTQSGNNCIEQQQCPVGTFSATGLEPNCQPCPWKTYASNTGTITCSNITVDPNNNCASYSTISNACASCKSGFTGPDNSGKCNEVPTYACPDRHHLRGGECVPCRSDQYWDPNTRTCPFCAEGCIQCTNGTSCDKCASNQYWLGSYCQYIANVNYHKCTITTQNKTYSNIYLKDTSWYSNCSSAYNYDIYKKGAITTDLNNPACFALLETITIDVRNLISPSGTQNCGTRAPTTGEFVPVIDCSSGQLESALDANSYGASNVCN